MSGDSVILGGILWLYAPIGICWSASPFQGGDGFPPGSLPSESSLWSSKERVSPRVPSGEPVLYHSVHAPDPNPRALQEIW